MIVLVTYDISVDKARDRLEIILRDFGLKRVQYSVFRGPINKDDRPELIDALNNHLKDLDETANIQIYPLTKKSQKKAIELTSQGEESIEFDDSDITIL